MWTSRTMKSKQISLSQVASKNVTSFRLFSSRASLSVDNPYTGEKYCEMPVDTSKEAHKKLDAAVKAQKQWKQVSLSERHKLCTKWIDILMSQADNIAKDITGQMGKPLQQSHNEVNGTITRAKALIELSNEALRIDSFPEENNLFRQITHEPVGAVYVIAPWNYPLMTAVNTIIPAILAGNSVVLKHSPRTPLCGEHYAKTFEIAGFPKNLLQASFVNHNVAREIILRPETAFVSFTGSVNVGRQVQKVASSRFIDVTLELGGKDPAYVAADANISAAAKSLVDGACYNAGQSCCGVERIYVHESKYEEFLDEAKTHFEAYHLGDPFDHKTNMGPMALKDAPKLLDDHVKDAIAKGARTITRYGITTDAKGKGRFYTPTLLADCDHSMKVMLDESFGPIVGVASVLCDEEAIIKMNDSAYGLTAAVFTSDKERAMRLGQQLSAGTIYMNRCDALDPYIPWTGVRDSGKGVSLSKHGFRALTKLKSWNFRV